MKDEGQRYLYGKGADNMLKNVDNGLKLLLDKTGIERLVRTIFERFVLAQRF
jgi:hypothetical protein